ncbi:hypothetical protein DFA_07925 [Cavenderia fasciculata]|uniref:DUF6787 domain-containing protein n=1 Tax=Cavenderia fasciculata TaxID=261658 RepID=F4Q430_CACFS|nr:uncharacterized protein DFA_07925 [Cavenderia fasciculata]EGG16944.1 hypothetical protein DFA_07925 [Cavenderia fasciculata]|eukprot:XP_004355418.1 hypothetical protein DFA_07925 [Cavenderia fasciculata]
MISRLVRVLGTNPTSSSSSSLQRSYSQATTTTTSSYLNNNNLNFKNITKDLQSKLLFSTSCAGAAQPSHSFIHSFNSKKINCNNTFSILSSSLSTSSSTSTSTSRIYLNNNNNNNNKMISNRNNSSSSSNNNNVENKDKEDKEDTKIVEDSNENNKNNITLYDKYLKNTYDYPTYSRKWFIEKAYQFAIFGVTGPTAVVVVKWILKNLWQVEGTVFGGPWQFTLAYFATMFTCYPFVLLFYGTLFARHQYFKKMFLRMTIGTPQRIIALFNKNKKNQ